MKTDSIYETTVTDIIGLGARYLDDQGVVVQPLMGHLDDVAGELGVGLKPTFDPRITAAVIRGGNDVLFINMARIPLSQRGVPVGHAHVNPYAIPPVGANSHLPHPLPPDMRFPTGDSRSIFLDTKYAHLAELTRIASTPALVVVVTKMIEAVELFLDSEVAHELDEQLEGGE